MPRPKTPRGRAAPRLPPIRVSTDELRWAQQEAGRRGHSLMRFQRDRIFAAMPGYKP